MVSVDIECFDTKHPTLSPSVAPTTPAPTLAPTEICQAIDVAVAAGGVQTYNGIYNKQTSTINGYDWWVQSSNTKHFRSTLTYSANDTGSTNFEMIMFEDSLL